MLHGARWTAGQTDMARDEEVVSCHRISLRLGSRQPYLLEGRFLVLGSALSCLPVCALGRVWLMRSCEPRPFVIIQVA